MHQHKNLVRDIFQYELRWFKPAVTQEEEYTAYLQLFPIKKEKRCGIS